MLERHDDPVRGIVYMCTTAIILFPFLNGLVKYLLAADYHIVQIVWVRSVVHCALMMALFMPSLGFSLFRSRQPRLQLVRSALQLLSLVLYVYPLTFVPLTTVTATFFTAPLMVVALSVPMLGERVGPRRWAAVAVGFVGAMIIIRPGADVGHWSVALIMGSAACYALFQILTRRIAGIDDDRVTGVYTILVALIASSAAVPFFWVTPESLEHGLVFLGLGFFGGLGHYGVIKAYQYGNASFVGPFDYGQLLGATVVGYLWFAEFPDIWTWVGAAIIVASGVYIARREARVRRGCAA